MKQDELERLRRAMRMDRETWTAILDLPESEYDEVIQGRARVRDRTLQSLEAWLQIPAQELMMGEIDVRQVAARHLGPDWPMLPRFTTAAFGRLRTALTVLDYVEQFSGWARRYDLLERLYLNEGMLVDPSRPVSIRLIMELMGSIAEAGWLGSSPDFEEIGNYSVVSNEGTELPALFRSTGSPRRIYERFVEELVHVYEENLDYRLDALDEVSCRIRMRTREIVAEASRVAHVGNLSTCAVRNGVIGSLPLYAGLPMARLSETRCVHRGDDHCELEVDFEAATRRFRSRGVKPLSGAA